MAPSTATTAGIPYSLAMIEQCESIPPDSEITAPAFAKRGVQLKSVKGITSTSPWTSLSMSDNPITILAGPS